MVVCTNMWVDICVCAGQFMVAMYVVVLTCVLKNFCRLISESFINSSILQNTFSSNWSAQLSFFMHTAFHRHTSLSLLFNIGRGVP